MKLATFTQAGRTRIGLADDSEIVDLAAAVPDLPQEMCAFLCGPFHGGLTPGCATTLGTSD